MHNDIKALRHILALAKHLNYTKAAQELFLSQPALTRSIQATEQRLNLHLFDRNRGGVHLTVVGKAFVEHAMRLVQEADDFDRQVKRMAGGDEYTVAFGMAPLPAKSLLTHLAISSLRQNNATDWRVEINSASELSRLLLNDKIEFFVCAEEQLNTDSPVKKTPLGKFPLSFIVRSNHPLLTDRKKNNMYPVLSVAPIKSYHSFPKALQDKLEFPPKLVVNDYALLANITAQTDAIWPMSYFAVMDELKKGNLATLSFPKAKSPTQFEIVMYSLSKRTLSSAAHKLQIYFKRRIQELKK